MIIISAMRINVMKRERTQQDGITLLITLLLMGILLAISTSLMNITLKQYQLSGIAHASEVAFQAANAGMECALYHDHIGGAFDIGSDTSGIQCFGVAPDDFTSITGIESGDAQTFTYEWSNGLSGETELCTEFTVYKFFHPTQAVSMNTVLKNEDDRDCPAGGLCTIIQSRGYNVGCDQLSGPRTVEREYTQVY
jgi:hypothetical protein